MFLEEQAKACILQLCANVLEIASVTDAIVQCPKNAEGSSIVPAVLIDKAKKLLDLDAIEESVKGRV